MDNSISVREQIKYCREAMEAWEKLLEDSTCLEHDYHKFLARHAGLFLAKNPCQEIIISKLELGSDFATDFIIVEDNFSNGFKYTLIEIESPHITKLYTKPQKPSGRLNTALAQIKSWKHWFSSHSSQAAALLPVCQGDTGQRQNEYKYMVIIGRRVNLEDNNAITGRPSHYQEGVEIRTFDYLTDVAKRKLRNLQPEGDTEQSIDDSASISNYSRCDWKSISHREWKEFLNKIFVIHLREINGEHLLKARQYNI